MNTIDEKVVSVDLENEGFVEGAEQTMSVLGKLEEALSSLGSNISTRAFDTFTATIEDKVYGMEVAINTVIVRLTNTVYDAVANITSSINSVTFEPIYSGFAKYESQIASVQTMMTATGKSIDTVSEQLQKLMWFTDETSYSYTQMSDSVGKFVSAGVSLDDAVTAMIGIANWAGAAGANTQEASRAMYNLAQAMGKGNVTLQDWASINTANMSTEDFKNALIDTAKEYKSWGKKYSEFVKQYGIDSAKFKEMAESNGHTVEEATKYYEYFNSAKLPKEFKSWSDLTPANLESTLSTKWLDSNILLDTLKKYGNYTEDLYKIYNQGDFDTANQAIDAYHDQYDGLIDKLYSIYREFGKNSKQFKDFVNENTMTMQTALDLVDTRSNQIFNVKLKKDAEQFAELAEKYGRESQNLADAAKKSGFTLSQALDIIDNGTKNYEKKEMSRGEEGFRKGQEAKTFTDAWGSAIEATSSQWLKFWEKVFGDYEEAKVTWTNLSNILWNVFAGPLEQLNEIAEVWKELEGRTALLDSVKNIWNATQRLFAPIQNAFNAIFPIFSNVEQMGTLVSDLTNEFRKFTESLSISTNTFIYLRVIAESVFTVVKTVLTVLSEVRNAVWNIIQSALGGNEILAYVAELAIKIASISEYTDDISIKIAEVSGRIIGYISTIRDRFVTPLIDEIKNFFFFFTNQTDKIGVGFLEKLANSKFGEKIFAIKESLVRFGETLRTIKEQLSNVDTSPLVKLYNDLKPVFSNIGDALVSGLLTAINLIINVLDLLARLGSKLLGFKDDWDSTVGIAIKNLALPSGLFDSIKEIFKAFSPIVDKIVEAVKGVISKVSEAFSKVDAFNAILAAFVLGIGTLFSTGIQTLADNFWMPLVKLRAGVSNFLGKAPEIFTSITGFIRDVVTEVGQYVNELPYLTTLSQYLRSIAGSLLMIAGAAVLFSTIDDPTKIVVIVGSMVAMVAGMTKILRGLRLSVGNQTAENVGQGKGLFGNFFGLNTELISLAAVFVSLGATMLLFSIAALNLSQLIENAEYPLERIVLILGTFGGMMLIMYLAVGGLLEITATPPAILKSGETANRAFLNAFNPVTKLLRTIAMVMIPLGIMVKVLGSMDLWSIVKGVGAIALLMLALYTATSSLYDIVNTPPAILKRGENVSKAFLRAYNPVISLLRTMALVMVPLGIMVKVLGSMPIDEIGKGLAAIGVLMLILYEAVNLLYKFTVNYSTTGNKRVLNLGKIALDLIPIALAIAMMAPPLILIGRLSLPDVLKGILGIVTIAGTLFGLVMGFSHLIDPTRIAPLLAASGALMMIAVAIGGMSATFIAIATLIPDKELQDKTLGTMVGMMLALVGTLFGIAVIVAGSIGEVLAGAGAMMMIAGAVSLFAAAFAIIGTSLSSMAALTGQDITEVAINSFVTTALMLVSLLGALDFLATMAANPKTIAKIAALAASMALIGLALDAVAFAVVSFSSVGENIIAGIFGVIGALTALGVFIKVMSGLVVDVPSMLAIGAGMAAIGAGLLLIAQAAKSFSEMSFGEILGSLVGLAAVMAVMAGISALLINAAPAMLGVAIAILAIGAALIVLGLGIEAIKIAFDEIDFEAAGAAIKEFFEGVAQKIGEGIAKVKEYIDTLKQLPQTAEQSGAAFYHFVHDEYWDPEQKAWVKKTAEHDIEVGADPYRTGYMDYDTGKWVQVGEGQTYDPYYDYDEGKSYAYDAYNEIGEYEVAGLDKGTEGMAEVARKRADEAIKATKEKFIIESPSKVFKEIGYMVVEGFKEGTNGYKDVAKTDAEIYEDVFGKETSAIPFDDLIFEKFGGDKVLIRFKETGEDAGSNYSDGVKDGIDDNLGDDFKITIRNFMASGLVDIDEFTQLGFFHGKQYAIGVRNGAIMELGEFKNGQFTSGSYLAGLMAASAHDSNAMAEFKKYVEFDSEGNVISGIFNYAQTGQSIEKQWQDWLDKQNKTNAKEVKEGLEAWAESLGLTGGVSEYIGKTISSYTDKLGVGGKLFGIEDAIESFKSTWGSETANGELDTESFSSALDKNLEKLLEYGTETKDNTDILNDNSDATKKATSATKSLSSATSEYNSKLRTFESAAKSVSDTLKGLTEDIANSFKNIQNEMSTEWAEARGAAYATAFIAATNKAYDKQRKEDREAEEAERVTNKEDADELAYLLTQDTNTQIRAANAYLADSKAWYKERNSYKGQVTSITNNALAAVDQYNKTNRSGQVKAQRTLASETDADYWRSKSDEVGSALQSLENEILDSAGYYKKDVTPQQRKLHETLLEAYLKIQKILEKYDLADDKANQAYSNYETLYTNIKDVQGDTYKENQNAKERAFYTDPKNIDKLYEDLNKETEYNRQLKEDITKTGLTEDQARQNRARLAQLRSMIFDKYGNERFGVDPALKNEYNRLMEDTSGAVEYLRKIDESDAKIVRLNEYANNMEEEANERMERESEDAEYEAQRAEANGEVTDETYDIDKSLIKAAKERITEANKELEKEISAIDGEIEELRGRTDGASKRRRADLNTERAGLKMQLSANEMLLDDMKNFNKLISEQSRDELIVEGIKEAMRNGTANGEENLVIGNVGTINLPDGQSWSEYLETLQQDMTERQMRINAVAGIGDRDILENEGGEENNPYVSAADETAKSFQGLRVEAYNLTEAFKDATKSMKITMGNLAYSSNEDKNKPYQSFDESVTAGLAILGWKLPSEGQYTKYWEKKNNVVKVKDSNGNEKYVNKDSEEAKNNGVATEDGKTVVTLAEASRVNAQAAREIVETKTKLDPIVNDTSSKLDQLITKVNDIYTNGLNYIAAMSEIQNGMEDIANSGVYLDSKTLIGKIAPGLDRTLGGFAFRRA